MSEFGEEDRAELERARRARENAQAASDMATASLNELHKTSHGIRVVTAKNGYLDRFRELIRGAV